MFLHLSQAQAFQLSAKAMRRAAVLWFVSAATGQLMFALYITAFYGGAAARGNYAAWEKVLSHGLDSADPAGNVVVASHLFLAVVITLGGLLQLVPKIRAKAPVVHRWVGRTYVLAAILISLGGLYLIWIRGAPSAGRVLNWIALSINALLILGFAIQALRYARTRDIKRHRLWALRLFVAASGVWFLRLGIMLWVLLSGGPEGLGEHLTGPAGVGLTFAQYLVPLTLLELYLRAQRSPRAFPRVAMAATLVGSAVATAVGAGMAAMALWLPNIT